MQSWLQNWNVSKSCCNIWHVLKNYIQNPKLIRNFVSKIFSFFPVFLLRLLLSKKPRKCHFWRFYGSNWPTKLSFWMQFFPMVFKLLKRLFVSQPDDSLIFPFKIWRLVKVLIHNLIFFRRFWSKECFFCKNISLRIKASKTTRNCQWCCFYTVRLSKQIDILERLFQWFLIFYKLFCFKPWCIVKVLIQINSDGCKEGCFKIWPVLDFWFSIWPDVKKWLEVRHVLIFLIQILTLCEKLNKSDYFENFRSRKCFFFQILLSWNYAFQESANTLFVTFYVFKTIRKLIFWKKISPLNLIIWHVLKFSIQILTKFKMLAQNMTCF